MGYPFHRWLIVSLGLAASACDRARVDGSGVTEERLDAADFVMAKPEKTVIPVINFEDVHLTNVGIVMCEPGESPLPVGKMDGEEAWKTIHKEDPPPANRSESEQAVPSDGQRPSDLAPSIGTTEPADPH